MTGWLDAHVMLQASMKVSCVFYLDDAKEILKGSPFQTTSDIYLVFF